MTEESSSIHAHETKKLGKLAPINRRSINAANFFQIAGVPDHPTTSVAPALGYPMDRNNEAGDCVVAGLDHALQAIAAQLGVPRTNWPDSKLLQYYQTQNPNFRGWSDAGDEERDGGMVIQTFLEFLIKRKEIVAFGRVDVDSPEVLRAATYVGLAIVTGEDLRVAQQSQTTWDYVKGSPDWGGHCTCTVGYVPDQQTGVSWGQIQPMTDRFVAEQVDEAWMIITQDMLTHPGFRNSFDLSGFSTAIQQLTGGKVIIPVPTPGPVVPPPPPSPVNDFPVGRVKPWTSSSHNYTRHEQNAKNAVKEWMAKNGL